MNRSTINAMSKTYDGSRPCLSPVAMMELRTRCKQKDDQTPAGALRRVIRFFVDELEEFPELPELSLFPKETSGVSKTLLLKNKND